MPYPMTNIKARVHAFLCFFKIHVEIMIIPSTIPSSIISRSGDGKYEILFIVIANGHV